MLFGVVLKVFIYSLSVNFICENCALASFSSIGKKDLFFYNVHAILGEGREGEAFKGSLVIGVPPSPSNYHPVK